VTGDCSNDRNESVFCGLTAVEEDRVLSCPILADLRDGRRLWQDLDVDERHAIGGPALVELLLELSYRERVDNSGQMVLLGRAACAVADRVDVGRFGQEVTNDLRARAWAELANAYRVADDLDKARRAFSWARDLAEKGSRSAPIMARLAELLASYLSDVGLFADSASLLQRARDLYANCGDTEGVSRTQVFLGLVLGYDGECDRAIIAFLQALEQLPPFSSLELSAVHGLALNLTDAGHPEWAQRVLRANLRLYRRAGKLIGLRLIWLEGKIAAGLQKYGRAEAKLNTARYAFLREGKTYDAALVSLDLAWVFARGGRRREVAWIATQMLQTFRSLGIARESIASIVLLQKSCEEERPIEALCGQIETLAKLMPALARGRRRESE